MAKGGYYCEHSAQDYEIRDGVFTCNECHPRPKDALACIVCSNPASYAQTFRVCSKACGYRVANFQLEAKISAHDKAYVDDMRLSRDNMRASWEHQVLVRADLERKVASLKDRVWDLESKLEELREATQALANNNFAPNSNETWARWRAAMAAAAIKPGA